MNAIPLILSLVFQNLPQLWDVVKTTCEAVAVHFQDYTVDQRKELVIKNLCSWYKLVDKQLNFDDEQDLFFTEKMLPDIVTWVYQAHKFDIRALVAKIFAGEAPQPSSAVRDLILAGDLITQTAIDPDLHAETPADQLPPALPFDPYIPKVSAGFAAFEQIASELETTGEQSENESR